MEGLNPFPKVLVVAETEVNGTKLSARVMVDGVAWNHAEYVRDEVKRQLRQKIADEILAVVGVEYTVHS